MILTKKINGDLEKIKKPFYPMNDRSKQGKKGMVTLSIGGNIGDVLRRFDKLFVMFRKSPFVSIVATSPILKNPPFGYLDQPDFYNAIIILHSNLKPKRLMRYLLNIEKRLGRKRTFQNAPRKIDIDMLRYDDRIINTRSLIIPYKKAMNRESVITPLCWMKRG